MATTDALTSDDDGAVPPFDYLYSEQQFSRPTRGDGHYYNLIDRKMTQSMSGPDRLRYAASKGDSETVADLICSGIPLEPDKDGKHAIHLAALNGHTQIVRMILDTGVEVDIKDNFGYTALHKAASQGHKDVIQLLVTKGADPNQQDTMHGNSPLHEAAWNGYSNSVDMLAKGGTYINIVNKSNFTALHLAAQNGHNQSARVLIYSGCDPNSKNNYGDTSLHTASRYGHAGVTRILLSARTRVNEVNKNWDTALHIAAALKRRKIAKLLRETGADLTIQNLQSETPIEVARRKGHEEILSILVSPVTSSGLLIDNHQHIPLSSNMHRLHTFDSMAAFNSPVCATASPGLPQANGAGVFPHPSFHERAPSRADDIVGGPGDVLQVPHSYPSNHPPRHTMMTMSAPGPNPVNYQRCRTPDPLGGTPPLMADVAAGEDVIEEVEDEGKKRTRRKSFFSLFRKKKKPVDKVNNKKLKDGVPETVTPTPTDGSKQVQNQPKIIPLVDRSNPVNQSMRAKKSANPQQPPTYSSNQNLVSNDVRHVPGLLSHYNAYTGTQYYRDLAGNVKEGPIGYAPMPQTCTCLDRHQYWNPPPQGHHDGNCHQATHNTTHFISAPLGPCLDHGYAEYHGPLDRRRQLLTYADPGQMTSAYNRDYNPQQAATRHQPPVFHAPPPPMPVGQNRQPMKTSQSIHPTGYVQPMLQYNGGRRPDTAHTNGNNGYAANNIHQQGDKPHNPENLPANAPITSMFPAPDPQSNTGGTRLFRSRSDESLNMSEHKQRFREEKMRQLAQREMQRYNQMGASGTPSGRESPVKGRRDDVIHGTAPGGPGDQGLLRSNGVLPPRVPERVDGSQQKLIRTSHQDLFHHQYPMPRHLEGVRPSPDGQQTTEVFGEPTLGSSAATTASLGYHSSSSNHAHAINSNHYIPRNNQLKLQKSFTPQKSPQPIETHVWWNDDQRLANSSNKLMTSSLTQPNSGYISGKSAAGPPLYPQRHSAKHHDPNSMSWQAMNYKSGSKSGLSVSQSQIVPFRSDVKHSEKNSSDLFIGTDV